MTEDRKNVYNTKPDAGVRILAEFLYEGEVQRETYLIAQVGPDAHMFIDLESGNRYSDMTFKRGEFRTVHEAFIFQTRGEVPIITLL